MEYKYYLLKDKFNMLTGYGSYSIKSIDDTDENGQRTIEVILLKLVQLKSYLQSGKIDESIKSIKLSHIYDRPVNYVQKNDIILSRITTSDEIDVLYVNQQPHNCVYPDSVIVLRAKNEEINTTFIYLMLKRMSQNHNLLRTILLSADDQNRRTSRIRVPRVVTNKMLDNLKMKEYSTEEQNEIVKQYEKIEKQRQKLNKVENDFYESLDTML